MPDTLRGIIDNNAPNDYDHDDHSPSDDTPHTSLCVFELRLSPSAYFLSAWRSVQEVEAYLSKDGDHL